MNLPTIDEIEAHAKALAKSHDVHATGAVLAGLVVIFLVFKASKFFLRLILVLVAIGLFAGAWWSHQHK